MVIFRPLSIFLLFGSICFAQRTPRRCADVPIPLSDGKTIHISQYHDKVVLIAMMKTDCPECHATLGFMSRLQHEMGARGFQAIAVAIDDNRALVKPYAERYRFPFPVGSLDPGGAIKLMDLRADAHPVVPYLIFVDWEGNVRFQYAGNDPIFNEAERNLRAVADGLLRQAIEKKGPTYETRPAGKQ
jgi:peroxiredoxin